MKYNIRKHLLAGFSVTALLINLSEAQYSQADQIDHQSASAHIKSLYTALIVDHTVDGRDQLVEETFDLLYSSSPFTEKKDDQVVRTNIGADGKRIVTDVNSYGFREANADDKSTLDMMAALVGFCTKHMASGHVGDDEQNLPTNISGNSMSFEDYEANVSKFKFGFGSSDLTTIKTADMDRITKHQKIMNAFAASVIDDWTVDAGNEYTNVVNYYSEAIQEGAEAAKAMSSKAAASSKGLVVVGAQQQLSDTQKLNLAEIGQKLETEKKLEEEAEVEKKLAQQLEANSDNTYDTSVKKPQPGTKKDPDSMAGDSNFDPNAPIEQKEIDFKLSVAASTNDVETDETIRTATYSKEGDPEPLDEETKSLANQTPVKQVAQDGDDAIKPIADVPVKTATDAQEEKPEQLDEETLTSKDIDDGIAAIISLPEDYDIDADAAKQEQMFKKARLEQLDEETKNLANKTPAEPVELTTDNDGVKTVADDQEGDPEPLDEETQNLATQTTVKQVAQDGDDAIKPIADVPVKTATDGKEGDPEPLDEETEDLANKTTTLELDAQPAKQVTTDNDGVSTATDAQEGDPEQLDEETQNLAIQTTTLELDAQPAKQVITDNDGVKSATDDQKGDPEQVDEETEDLPNFDAAVLHEVSEDTDDEEMSTAD